MSEVIADLPHAVLRQASPNEISFDQKDDGSGYPTMEDPIKLRFGAWNLPRGKYYIGTIGMDVLRRDGNGNITREEVGFIKLAVDEMVDGDGDPVPMIELFLAPKVGQSQDTDMERVVTISRKGAIFRVPTNASGKAITDRMISGDSRFVTIQQGDGNFVTYDSSLGPVGDRNAAIWSAWGGKIERSGLMSIFNSFRKSLGS